MQPDDPREISAAKTASMTPEKHQRYNSIDLCKFLMAFCVVAIHTHPVDSTINKTLFTLYSVLLDLAVPFFFLAGGFLLGKDLRYPYSDRNSLSKIRKYLMRMVKYYCIWSLIYLPLAISSYRSKGWDIGRSIRSYIQGFFFIGEHFNSWMLWYLLSAIYALILILFLLKYLRCSPETAAKTGSVILLVSIGLTFLSGYDGPLPGWLHFIRTRLPGTIVNGRILLGCFYLPIGILLSRYDVSAFVSVYAFILGLCLRFSADNSFSNGMSAVLCSTGFFVLVKGIKLPDSKIYFVLRKMSTVIYFIHLLVWTAYYSLKYEKITYGVESFLAVSLISTITAAVYVCCRYRKILRKNQRSLINSK